MSEKRYRVLAVDDELHILKALQAVLQEEYEVDIALSGTEGLELIRTEGSYAVILSDMRMPGMDGASFLTEAKEAAPDSVRMMLTGFADIESALPICCPINRKQRESLRRISISSTT